MNLTNRKIEAVAPKKDGYTYLNGVYYDTDNKALVASNGAILVKLAVTPDTGDESALLSHESIAHARRVSTGKLYSKALYMRTSNDKVTFADGVSHPTKKVKYPEYSSIIPNGEPTIEIGLDAKLLYNLAQGLCRHGEYRVKLSITNAGDAVRVTALPPVDEDDVGVIMPVRF